MLVVVLADQRLARRSAGTCFGEEVIYTLPVRSDSSPKNLTVPEVCNCGLWLSLALVRRRSAERGKVGGNHLLYSRPARCMDRW